MNQLAPDLMDIELRLIPRNSDSRNSDSRNSDSREPGYILQLTVSSAANGEQEFSGPVDASALFPWMTTGDMQADGARLFNALFTDVALRDAWVEARGRSPQRRVRLRLDTGVPRLHTLPWEMLFADGNLLAVDSDTPFSRYLPSPFPWGKGVAEHSIRVLVVIANPADLSDYNLSPLDIAAERTLLEATFANVEQTGMSVKLEFLDPPVTLKRLEDALRVGFHVLHFVGHGIFNKRLQQAALYIQGQDGDAQRLRDMDLIAMLARLSVQPRLIYLAACQSATRSTTNAFLGLGPKLVQAGVPAVVAMQDFISVTAAQSLGQAFYQSLLRQAGQGAAAVDVAMNEARSALLALGQPGVAIPVLFMRLRSGLLWSDEVTPPNPDVVLDQQGMTVYGAQANIVGDGDFVSGDKVTYNYQLDVPKLVGALREVLPDDDPEPERLLSILAKFQTLHVQLYEWKELHNYLNDIIYVMDQFSREVERLDAREAGSDRNTLRSLQRLWRPVANKVKLLLDWAADEVSHIASERLMETEAGLRGPRWAIELRMAQKQLEVLLQPGEFDLLALYDTTYNFTDVADRQMYLADKHLRDTAGELYDLSQVVLGSLQDD
ncbi:MAG: CHAT domain-containing protein [Anaerolineae bacterium]|nr:CHAT domain-containing protein [Anaerolineae bacterium]